MKPDYENPEQMVLDFIKSARLFTRKCPIGPKGDTKACQSAALEIIHAFTFFKFHPYSDHRLGLDSVKKIREIDKVVRLGANEIQVFTKKNPSAIPACRFTLSRKHNQWKIAKVEIIQGINHFFSLFIS